jgi:hypothetical protein
MTPAAVDVAAGIVREIADLPSDYFRHCLMSEASQSKPAPNMRTAAVINLPGMGWECGQASSM